MYTEKKVTIIYKMVNCQSGKDSSLFHTLHSWIQKYKLFITIPLRTMNTVSFLTLYTDEMLWELR